MRQQIPVEPVMARPEEVIADAAVDDAEIGPRVAAAYRELAGMLLGQQPLASTLSRIATLTRVLVEGADDVSITLISPRTKRTVAFAGDSKLAYILDERQYADGFGPCLDAAVSGERITIDDTSSTTLYTGFAALADSHGVRHTLAAGLPSMHNLSGAVNLYGRSAGGFSDEAKQTAKGFCTYVAISITNAALYADAIQEAAQLTEAMRSRATIEQAKGMIMNSHRCGADQAFQILREVSMSANRKLHDIALEITAQSIGAKPGHAE